MVKEQILSLVKNKTKLAVAGLGNSLITPDAIGPITVDNLIVTRHILQYHQGKFGKKKNRIQKENHTGTE